VANSRRAFQRARQYTLAALSGQWLDLLRAAPIHISSGGQDTRLLLFRESSKRSQPKKSRSKSSTAGAEQSLGSAL
jgi:hypothetical protein